MTPEQYKKATPLIDRLQRTEKALFEINDFEIENYSDNIYSDFKPMDGTKTQYALNIVEYKDGSGKSVSLDGVYVAKDILTATKKILKERRELLLNDLKNISNNH